MSRTIKRKGATRRMEEELVRVENFLRRAATAGTNKKIFGWDEEIFEVGDDPRVAGATREKEVWLHCGFCNKDVVARLPSPDVRYFVVGDLTRGVSRVVPFHESCLQPFGLDPLAKEY